MNASVPSIWVSLQSWFTPTALFVLINIIIFVIAFFPSKNTHNRLPRQLSRTSSIFDGLKSFNLHRQSTQDPIPPTDTAVDNIPPPGKGHGSLPSQLSRTSSYFESLRSFSLYRQSTQETIPTVEALDQNPPPAAAEPETTSELPRQLSRTSALFESLRSFNLYRQTAHQQVPPVTTVEQQAIETVETVDHVNFSHSQSETHPTAEDRREQVGLKKIKKSASSRTNVEHLVEDTGGVQRPKTMREGKAAKEEEEEVDVRADDFINRFRQQLKLQRLDSLLRYKEMLNRGK